VITEGANSFITPAARSEIQKKGVIVLRDASANKCGVISSSYEIIANLLMTAKEFLAHKEAYVQDVLAILEKRAEEEANLIFRRYREADGKLFYTDISMQSVGRSTITMQNSSPISRTGLTCAIIPFRKSALKPFAGPDPRKRYIQRSGEKNSAENQTRHPLQRDRNSGRVSRRVGNGFRRQTEGIRQRKLRLKTLQGGGRRLNRGTPSKKVKKDRAFRLCLSVKVVSMNSSFTSKRCAPPVILAADRIPMLQLIS